jgi:hypothetical protein
LLQLFNTHRAIFVIIIACITHYASLIIQELKNSILPPKMEGAELATKQLCVKLSDENEVMSSVFAVVAAHLAAPHHYSLRFFHLKC